MSEQSESPVVLKVTGDFSFTLNHLFQEVLHRYPKGQHAFAVDLASVQALDDSALGMLLQLRDHSRDGVSVTLRNPSEPVRAALKEALIGGLLTVAVD